jgi:FkbM family methyltransferase
MSDTPFDRILVLLSEAEKSLSAGEYATAIETLDTILKTQPDNYWALLMLGRTSREQGDMTAATRFLRAAIALPTPERIGAFYDLALDRIAERSIAEASSLIEEALGLPDSGQSRWYKGRLMFLRALAALGNGRARAADAALADAYRFSRSIDEMPFLFDWVRDEVVQASLQRDLVYFRYLAARIDETRETIVYQRELEKFGPGTPVLAIGAMDGKRFDPLWDFIRDREWRAVLVEPTAAMFSALTRNYANCPFVRCARLAIVENDGPVKMYRIRPEAVSAGLIGDWALGLSSVSLDSTLKFYPELVETETVDGSTFRTFAAQYEINRVDVLQIDTEGHDYAVLKQIRCWRLGFDCCKLN